MRESERERERESEREGERGRQRETERERERVRESERENEKERVRGREVVASDHLRGGGLFHPLKRRQARTKPPLEHQPHNLFGNTEPTGHQPLDLVANRKRKAGDVSRAARDSGVWHFRRGASPPPYRGASLIKNTHPSGINIGP